MKLEAKGLEAAHHAIHGVRGIDGRVVTLRNDEAYGTALLAIRAYLSATGEAVARNDVLESTETADLALGDLGFELKPFKPGQIILRDAGVTEYVYEDTSTVSVPIVEGLYHTADWLLGHDGRLVGVQFWAIHEPLAPLKVIPATPEEK